MRGKKKYIETPEKMWELFCAYRNQIRNNPFTAVEQRKGTVVLPKGFDGDLPDSIIELPLRRPLTMEGFENYCADEDIIEDLGHYFANTDNAYDKYRTICHRIKKVIRQDQIEGGMAGLYNASITQRLNGLSDKVDNRLVDGEGNDRSFDITLNLK